jgi:hypothetical protein
MAFFVVSDVSNSGGFKILASSGSIATSASLIVKPHASFKLVSSDARSAGNGTAITPGSELESVVMSIE